MSEKLDKNKLIRKLTSHFASSVLYQALMTRNENVILNSGGFGLGLYWMVLSDHFIIFFYVRSVSSSRPPDFQCVNVLLRVKNGEKV